MQLFNVKIRVGNVVFMRYFYFLRTFYYMPTLFIIRFKTILCLDSCMISASTTFSFKMSKL